MAESQQITKHCNGVNGCGEYHAKLSDCKIRDKNRRARIRKEGKTKEVEVPVIESPDSSTPFDDLPDEVPSLISDKVFFSMNEIKKLAQRVNDSLGSGYDESTYQKAMLIDFQNAGVIAESERDIPIIHSGYHIANKRIDILLKSYLPSILELKATTKDGLKDVERVQLMRYMSLTGIKYGFLINFVQTVSMASHIHVECYTFINDVFYCIDLESKNVTPVTI